jgi:hypothetical protein
VPTNDPLHGSKPDPCALEFLRGVQALEHTKELILAL